MELSRETGQRLSDLIHRLCGLSLGPNKNYLIRHRLGPLVRREGLGDFEQFLDRLKGRDRTRLHDAIIEAITTKETSFFRDSEFFDGLKKVVLPDCAAGLKQAPGQRRRVRIWSAACSTGQEPYSVAMLIRDFVAAHSAGPREAEFAVLASDISGEAIEAARAGRYTRRDVDRGVSEGILARHFRRDGAHWEVTEATRRIVQFRRFDLLQSADSLGLFDLILCRNVLIYFDEPTRRRVCEGLHSLLYPGGWLALGAAESLLGVERLFESVPVGRMLLYRRR
jgi:chemotaxis protein methyltransferase CheR